MFIFEVQAACDQTLIIEKLLCILNINEDGS
jgi:hypothetical protein